MSDDLIDMLSTGLFETIYMIVATSIIAFIIGFPLGILVAVTEKGGIWEHQKINKVLGTFINIFRSFPSIILIVILLPLSRLVVGTTLGTTAAIVPLSIGSAPYLARIIENAIKEVERGKIEATQSMGANQFQIITKVLIPEALPSLIRGITLGVITITGFTAVAGAIGAGGLGSLAIRYGYMRFRNDIMVSTVVILILIVEGLQFIGDLSARLVNKKRYKFE
jgi:D-methionine transport system permease protein